MLTDPLTLVCVLLPLLQPPRSVSAAQCRSSSSLNKKWCAGRVLDRTSDAKRSMSLSAGWFVGAPQRPGGSLFCDPC